jgi:S-adenosylmethionine:tRNA-ribosyltransferase-isomerase (queuine synthetase)
MVCDKNKKQITHEVFDHVINTLDQEYRVFFNNSKVIKARIPLITGDNCNIYYGDKEVVIDHGELFYLAPV